MSDAIVINNAKDFGRVLHQFLGARTIRDVAEKSGINRHTLGSYFGGWHWPPETVMTTILTELNVPAETQKILLATRARLKETPIGLTPETVQLGEALRALRVATKLTGAQLARDCEIRHPMISNYELGLRVIVIDVLLSVLRRCGLTTPKEMWPYIELLAAARRSLRSNARL